MHKEEEIEEEMIFSPMGVFDHPRRKDIVGQAGEFIDDFADSIKSEELYHVMGVKPDKSFLITAVTSGFFISPAYFGFKKCCITFLVYFNIFLSTNFLHLILSKFYQHLNHELYIPVLKFPS